MVFLLRLENVFSFCMNELRRFLIAALLRLGLPFDRQSAAISGSFFEPASGGFEE
jgi:hypothetical protein